MKFKLQACNIWELGQRARQEDSIFPPYGKITAEDRLFVLCDGMGGHDAGDLASSTVAEALGHAVLAHVPNPEGPFTDDEFRAALTEAFDALDRKDNGAAKKMGTTMTFLKFHSGGCTIAHIGDSRVYHIRSGATAADTHILFQTTDHSLVNDLVRVGELTPEEAKTSPHKNVITRAMQPNMDRRPKADIYHTSDLAAGDYFLMCSDGILEQMEDENLQYIFSEKTGDLANKAEMLIRVTEQNHDNHTAVLVRIDEVIGEPEPIVPPQPTPTPTPVPQPKRPVSPEHQRVAVMYGSPSPRSNARRAASASKPKPQPKPQSNALLWLVCLLIVLMCCGGGYYAYTRLKKADAPTEQRHGHRGGTMHPKTIEDPSPKSPDSAEKAAEKATENVSENAAENPTENAPEKTAEQSEQTLKQTAEQAASAAESEVNEQKEVTAAKETADQATQKAKEVAAKLKQTQAATSAAEAPATPTEKPTTPETTPEDAPDGEDEE